MTPHQFFKKSHQDPYFVASLSDADLQALRAGTAHQAAGMSKRVRLGRWFETGPGIATLLLPFYGGFFALVGLLDLLHKNGHPGFAVAAIVIFVATVAGLHWAQLTCRSALHMAQALDPLSTDDQACHLALKLVTESAACRAYRDQVLAHPRELVLADLTALKHLYGNTQLPGQGLSAQQACQALHGLAPLPGALP